MLISRRPPQATTRFPKRRSATTILVWAFVIIEALGIGYALTTFSSRVP
jgi:hypothetical protein